VAVRMVTPLALSDVFDSMKEQGVAGGTALSLLAIFGMGVQTYQSSEPGKPDAPKRLKIDTTGMTDAQIRQAVFDKETEIMKIRARTNKALDSWMKEAPRNSGQLRVWLKNNIQNENVLKAADERARLFNRAKDYYPDAIKGSFSPSDYDPTKPPQPPKPPAPPKPPRWY
jgi:hypothetical protein